MHKNEKIKSLRGKIILAIIAVVCLTLLCVGAISLIGANRITKTLTQSNEEMTQTSRSRSSSSRRWKSLSCRRRADRTLSRLLRIRDASSSIVAAC